MKRDRSTLDLFKDFETKPAVARFAEEEVRAWSGERRLSRAISRTLDEAERNREQIAEAMSEHLGERVSKAMLDNYAAQEKPHTISARRLAGLVAVTGDARALNTLLGEIGLIAVEAKYEALLRREKAKEIRERAEREEQAADAEWRANR